MTKSKEKKKQEKKDELKKHTWSKNLELEEHGKNIGLIKKEAIESVKKTGRVYFVNLVTHQNHGHPSNYLYDNLKNKFSEKIKIEYVDQCGCDGYVTRVHIL